MKTMQRLTSAYRGARVEEFDENSRYVIMSDCHRGDGSVSDEFLKNKNVYLAALGHYWKQGFTYIEAGLATVTSSGSTGTSTSSRPTGLCGT